MFKRCVFCKNNRDTEKIKITRYLEYSYSHWVAIWEKSAKLYETSHSSKKASKSSTLTRQSSPIRSQVCSMI